MGEGNKLRSLGARQTVYPQEPTLEILETFENQYPGRNYVIVFDCPEFTSLCPVTGQPDFGTLHIEYVADKKCIESKSLKLYLFSYRNKGSFVEAITNRVLEDLVSVCSPRWMKVTGDFNRRGGIKIIVQAEYSSEKSALS